MLMEELIIEGRNLELYAESEQADIKAQDSDTLDALWQSIYDVYHLVIVGIIEGDIQDEAMEEARTWLEKTKGSTTLYKDIEL